ncbi:MAG: polysaccharide pyruvyl transferase family protein [Opitutales bacterium]
MPDTPEGVSPACDHAAVDVESHLSTLRGERFYFLPNYGNAGDSLIALATYQMFHRLGLNWQRLDPARARKANARGLEGKTLVYGGGGGLTPDYDHGSDPLNLQAERLKRVIILPHTIVGQETLLQRLGSRATIFCREARTLAHVQARAPQSEVLAAHDLGLSLNVKDARREPHTSEVLTAWMHNRLTRRGTPGMRANQRRLKAALAVSMPKGTTCTRKLFCFRTDKEQPEGTLPENNIDLSVVYGYHVAPEAAARMSVSALLRHIDAFQEVHTNRLHVAIAAGLLGKQVFMSGNNYFKNRAVFEFSLRDRFPNLQWEDAPLG